MDLSAAVTADVLDLCSIIGADPEAIAGPLADLNRDMRTAVDSFVGLQMVHLDHGHPTVLTLFEPKARSVDIASSLHLELAALAGGGAGAVTWYASRAGAFVDLAADLSYALGLDRSAGDGSGRPVQLCLDHELTASSWVSGLSGAADTSTINRAVGVLIGQGHQPAAAHRELVRLAAAADVTMLAYAVLLLRPGPTQP